MADTPDRRSEATTVPAVPGTVVGRPADSQAAPSQDTGEAVTSPGKVMRIGTMVKQLLEEDTPSEAELRVAQAQLVGWLEGLFQGIQATLFAQQMAARNQLAEMRGRALPGGSRPDAQDSQGTGLYL